MQNFGKYEIVGKIGEGGFGVVYEAFDPRIARRVAIKTCPTDDETLRQRFLHEARISGSLHHRNIIVVYDYGEAEDVPYLVQEFLTGEDLDDKIDRRDPIPLQTKIEYLVQAAEGLDYAHQQGIIHRDIKPSNIRILDGGQVKIMDFGIAKLRDSELALTLPGQTVGTPAYLAPEQIRNLELDARCDVYAFGLLAYELLTHRKAYSAKNASRVLYQILNEDPPRITDHWPGCPPALVAIVERCYRKDRDERFQTLGEVATALRELLAGEPAAAAQTPRPTPVDLESETMVTPGGTLQDAQRAIREAAGRAPTVRSEGAPDALDQMELGGVGTPVPAPADAGEANEERRSARTWGLLAAALLAVALVVGWLALGDGDGESADAGSPAPTASEPAPAGSRSVTADAEAPGGAAASDSDDALPSSPEPAVTDAVSQTPTVAAPAARRSTLVLPASWDPTMTATVDGGASLLLDREHTVELTPGQPIGVTFRSSRPGYEISETVELGAERDERTVVPSPIAPPGALTVRAGLGASRLHVVIDGEAVGFTPVAGRLTRPGLHTVQVASDDSDDPESSLTYELELVSQEEVVLTFDLRRSTPSVARRPYRN